jgi:hypothetical protein
MNALVEGISFLHRLLRLLSCGELVGEARALFGEGAGGFGSLPPEAARFEALDLLPALPRPFRKTNTNLTASPDGMLVLPAANVRPLPFHSRLNCQEDWRNSAATQRCFWNSTRSSFCQAVAIEVVPSRATQACIQRIRRLAENLFREISYAENAVTHCGVRHMAGQELLCPGKCAHR